jgi:hypothetical protein
MRRGIAMAVSSGLVLGGAMAGAGVATAATVRMPAAVRVRAAARTRIVVYAENHDVKATPDRDGQVTAVVGTYGDNPALIRQVLATVRPGPVEAKGTATAAGRDVQAPPTGQPALEAQATPPPTVTAQPLARLPSRPARPKPRPRRKPVRPGPPTRGFDACTAPPMAAMKAWRRRYSVVGIYIGGVNAACDGGNLSAHWIAAAAKMGWSMLPVYVGPQAPCLGYSTVISYRKAAQQGAAAATDAARDARRYGLRAGSPIYYDMEAYEGNYACTDAVLEFLSAWTRELNARGYVSGVYSSWNSGIADMQSALTQNRRFTPPQAIWYALWDGRGNLGGNLAWPKDRQAKQFQGPHNSTIGGYTLDVDTDIVDGPVAR